MNKNPEYDEIVLVGNTIRIFDNKVQFFKSREVTIEDFRPTCDKLMRYMIDEAFIPKEMMKVEIITL